jgi:hypothetical protein
MAGRTSRTKRISLGGMTAALAVVIMCMGGLIPVATFVCPMMCMIMLWMMDLLCGRRIAWAWYGTVAILSVLMGPDKEAAAVFLVLGFYPLVKPKLDKLPLSFLWKLVLFNLVIGLLYTVMIHLFGMAEIAEEYTGLGIAMVILLVVMGNITFFMLDRIFSKLIYRKKKEKRAGR